MRRSATTTRSISLSDLHTPWEDIAARLSAAARSDYVIVLYNPRSARRTWQIEQARAIILEHRSADTPVGLVTDAARAGQVGAPRHVGTVPLRGRDDDHLCDRGELDDEGGQRADGDPEGVRPVIVVSDACTACGACLATCPTGALRAAPRRPSVTVALCTACLDCVEICPRGAAQRGRPVTALPPGNGAQDAGGSHPIEQESYRILAERVDLSSWPAGPAAVAARIVHATAEPDLLGSLVVDAQAVAAGVAALRDGLPVLCDVEMVRSGVAGGAALCLLGEVGVAPAGSTRSAAAMAHAARRYPNGAVVVVGCAPTALDEVNDRLADGSFRPALVIGVPVGFVGAAAAKERLLEVAPRAGVAAIVLRGERGGAAVGVAVVNALVRLARGAPEPAVAPGPAVSGHDVAVAVGPGRRETAPTMVLIGHGTRSEAGQAELHAFGRAMAEARPDVPVRPGFIEFMRPTLAEALESAAIEASAGATGEPGSSRSPWCCSGPAT